MMGNSARRTVAVFGLALIGSFATGSLEALAQTNGLTGTYYQWPAGVTDVPPPPPGSPEGPQPPAVTWTVTATRTDATVNFVDNAAAAWAPAGVGPNTFTVVWTGFLLTGPDTGTYTFQVNTDDGSRLWVSNIPAAGVGGGEVINSWVDQGNTAHTGTVTLNADTFYPIRYEFYQNGGGTAAVLSWSSTTVAMQVIPTGNLVTTMPPPPTAGVLSATPGVAQVVLDWTAATGTFGTPAVSYTVQRRATGTVAWTTLATTGGLTYTDTTGGVTTSYDYQVVVTQHSQSTTTNIVTTASLPIPPHLAGYQGRNFAHRCGCSTLSSPGGTAVLWSVALLMISLVLLRRR